MPINVLLGMIHNEDTGKEDWLESKDRGEDGKNSGHS